MHLSRAVILGLILAIGRAAEQEPARVTVPNREAETTPRPRTVSPRIAALLAAAVPRFEATATAATNPAPAPVAARENAAGDKGIVRLPSFVVNERQLPKAEEVERGEVARRAMNRYLGPSDGIDRGLLNRITSEQIPLLALFGSVSNEARAMAQYREDERLQKMTDLMELATLTKAAGDAAGAAKLKRATRDAFRRD